MEVRIYKTLLNGKETADSYTIWLKPTKQAARNGAMINAFCCNSVNGRVRGYWLGFDAETRIGVGVYLGKRQKLESVPAEIRAHAERLNEIWSEACESDNWDAWEAI